MLTVGEKAPNFALKDKDGKIISLKELKAKKIIVYFYPKDNTPGCTIEAKGFNEDLEAIEKMGIKVIGISGGNEKTKKQFCDKHELKLDLLSDEDFTVSRNYGVYGEKSFMGRKFMGINRVTYLLDEEKKVLKVYDKVKPQGHASEIIRFVKTMGV